MGVSECELRTRAFEGSKYADSWIEIYHSRISWTSALISYKKDGDAWVPFGKYKLLDADDVRPGFRAFRVRAARLEFLVRDGGNTTGKGGIESRKAAGDDAAPHVIYQPGRYVLSSDETTLRRVGPADTVECLRKSRPCDKYVEFIYHTGKSQASWRRVYAVSVSGGKYSTSAPMKAMGGGGRDVWHHRCAFGKKDDEAEYIEIAFTDGNGQRGQWDNNYRVYVPGKYCINDCNGESTKRMLYLGPSDADLHLNRYSMPKSEHSSRLLDSCRDFLNRAERRRHEKREALEARYLGKKKAFTLCCLLAYDEKYAIGPVDYPTNLVRDKIIEESARRMREITREENFLTICYPALYAVLKHPLCNLTHAQKINAVARWLRSFRSGRAKYVQQLVEEVLPIQQKMKLKHRIEANFAFGFNSDVYKFYLLNWL